MFEVLGAVSAPSDVPGIDLMLPMTESVRMK